MKISQSRGDIVFNVVMKFMMFLLFIVIVYPLVFILSASISEPDVINMGEMLLIPKQITFEGYSRVFKNGEIWIGYRNTILYTFFGTLINLAVTIPAAYALSHTNLMGNRYITLLFIFTMFFNGGLIPNYLLMKSLNLLDTVWVMVLPGAVSAYNLFISRSFFSNPDFRELESAAAIDGCGQISVFIKIILPLSTPIIAVMALFYGIGHWNSYFNAMIYLNNREIFPLQVFLREILIMSDVSDYLTVTAEEMDFIAQQARISELVKYVLMIISTVPVLIIYPFLQKFFIKGVMVGSIKG